MEKSQNNNTMSSHIDTDDKHHFIPEKVLANIK